MAVLMISDIGGQTAQGYGDMLDAVSVHLAEAPGFVTHMSHPTDAGWRVIEVWATREHAGQFFAAHIAPRLAEGIRPKLTFVPLHDVLQPAVADGSRS